MLVTPPGEPVIEITAGAVALSGRPVLRDIDLTLHPGEVVALLGANGSGKSTLVRAITGLVQLSRGEVRLYGTPLASFHDWSRLGYVPQRSAVGTGVPTTVREVVASGRLSRRRPFMPARQADQLAVAAALDTVGLAHRARHSISTLSGGQQQRVLIARTLAGQAELMILDEPNAGVDLASQEAIAATLTQLTRNGATMLVVLHELGPLAPLITRAVVLRQGRIVYDGPPSGVAHDAYDMHHRDSPEAVADPVVAPDLLGPLEDD